MRTTFVFILLTLATLPSLAQSKGKVENGSGLSRAATAGKCGRLAIGKVESMPSPKYPADAREAKIGGAVDVTVAIDENGRVTAVEKISGPPLLHGAAVEAAMKARFAQTLCDNRPVRISGVLSYNFIPLAPGDRFFVAENIDAFRDVSRDSPYFEAILDLTENYRIAFGYGDRNYYPDLPMPRGDFAHQLRLTLEFLRMRATDAGIATDRLYRASNPKRIDAGDKIRFSERDAAYSDSIVVLLRNFDISLFDDRDEFDGRTAVRRGEVISIWKRVFGDDVIPVNFEQPETADRVISRGEFALFLQESMRILTYKLLPDK